MGVRTWVNCKTESAKLPTETIGEGVTKHRTAYTARTSLKYS